jgi:integrase
VRVLYRVRTTTRWCLPITPLFVMIVSTTMNGFNALAELRVLSTAPPQVASNNLLTLLGIRPALEYKRAIQMAFRMSRLARTKSGAYRARIGIPKDVRDDYQALHSKRWEELFHRPASFPLSKAKADHSEWVAGIESRIATIRAKQRGEGHDLTPHQAHGLAGEWYRWYIRLHEGNPGQSGHWAEHSEFLLDRIADVAGEWVRSRWHHCELDFKAPGVRKHIHPIIADECKTAQFLASRGEVLTPAAMTLFLDEVLQEFLVAADLLKHRAARDHSADPHLQTLPEYRKTKPAVLGAGKTCLELFEAYIKAANPAPYTVNRWRVVFTTLDEHLDGRDIDAFSTDDAQHWAGSLVTDKRSRRTVSDVWVTAAKSVFAWALTEKHIATNPVVDVSIHVPKTVINREDGKAFSDREQQVILKAALAINDTKRPFQAACRWVPWLCAYSGARAGEITQLRVQDIERQDGFVAMKIKPEAGAVKGSMPRTVPIHEHVIEQGFLDYVSARGSGPLFYDPAKDASGNTDITKPKRPRYVKTRERLAEWVRGLGITGTEIQPNHAWRHTFKQRAARTKIEKVMRDTICGHATKAVADEYEKPNVKDMARALKQFPRYEIDNSTQPRAASRVSESTEAAR